LANGADMCVAHARRQQGARMLSLLPSQATRPAYPAWWW
jgi:hypothetical protein